MFMSIKSLLNSNHVQMKTFKSPTLHWNSSWNIRQLCSESEQMTGNFHGWFLSFKIVAFEFFEIIIFSWFQFNFVIFIQFNTNIHQKWNWMRDWKVIHTIIDSNLPSVLYKWSRLIEYHVIDVGCRSGNVGIRQFYRSNNTKPTVRCSVQCKQIHDWQFHFHCVVQSKSVLPMGHELDDTIHGTSHNIEFGTVHTQRLQFSVLFRTFGIATYHVRRIDR